MSNGIRFFEKYKMELLKIGKILYENPEIANQEYFAISYLSKFLKNFGFEIEKNICGYETGFIAKKSSKKGDGKKIAFLAEYDALPKLGHGCGHNLIAMISVASAICLSQILDDIEGTVYVVGTPAEEGGENGSAKVIYTEKGIFSDIDVAFMIHPGNNNTFTIESLSVIPVEFEFFGVATHTVSSSKERRDALETIVYFFNKIYKLKEKLPINCKIDGVILDGGTAPNIVSEYTKGRFYLRAKSDEECENLLYKLETIAQEVSFLTGCKYKINFFQKKVSNLIPTKYLDKLYEQFLEEPLEITTECFSTDAGNVSQVIPILHPILKITESYKPLHTKEFVKAVNSEFAYIQAEKGIRALILLGEYLFKNKDEFEKIKIAYETVKNS